MTQPVTTTCESCGAPLPPRAEQSDCKVCGGAAETVANPLEARSVALSSLMLLAVSGTEETRLRAAEMILESTLPLPGDEW